MNIQTVALVAGLGVATAFGAGAASAQVPDRPGSSEPTPYHHHHSGVFALVKEEVQAGRISRTEGAYLVREIRKIHAERRAQREGGQYGSGMPEAPPNQMPSPH
jgi:hypothetical protein